MGDFIRDAVERFELFEFTILNTHVELRAAATPMRRVRRLYICELRQDAASGRRTNAYGVYRDDYRRVDGRWRFARRSYQSLARNGRDEVFPIPAQFDFD